jgi:hypothetical protein
MENTVSQIEQHSSSWEQQSLDAAMLLLQSNSFSTRVLSYWIERVPFAQRISHPEAKKAIDRIAQASEILPQIRDFIAMLQRENVISDSPCAEFDALILDQNLPAHFGVERRVYMLAMTYFAVRTTVLNCLQADEEEAERFAQYFLYHSHVHELLAQVHTSVFFLLCNDLERAPELLPEDGILLFISDIDEEELVEYSLKQLTTGGRLTVIPGMESYTVRYDGQTPERSNVVFLEDRGQQNPPA